MTATLRPALRIVAKALIGGHITATTACRMVAFAVLAKTETAKQPHIMHLRFMRAAFRRDVRGRVQTVRLPVLSACH